MGDRVSDEKFAQAVEAFARFLGASQAPGAEFWARKLSETQQTYGADAVRFATEVRGFFRGMRSLNDVVFRPGPDRDKYDEFRDHVYGLARQISSEEVPPLKYSELDAALDEWGRANGVQWVRLHRDEEVRSASLYIGPGRCAQIWLERVTSPPQIAVCASDNQRNHFRETGATSELVPMLSRAVSAARAWEP